MSDSRRRMRILYVPERSLIEILRGKIRFAELPEGMRVVRCFADADRMGLGVIVEHESFDSVPDGELIPHFGPMLMELVDTRPQMPTQIAVHGGVASSFVVNKEPYIGLDGGAR